MKQLPKVDKRDYKLVPAQPDADFNPEHNERIIEEVIRETDIVAKKKRKDFEEKLRERSEAVAMYLNSIKQGGQASDLINYFGRKYMAYLRGHEVLDDLKTKFLMKKGKPVFDGEKK